MESEWAGYVDDDELDSTFLGCHALDTNLRRTLSDLMDGGSVEVMAMYIL